MSEQTAGPAARAPHPEATEAAEAAEATEATAYAECVLCRKPTEHPETVRGVTLCPVCEWQEAQRTACSG
ncbi:hypothetical protein AB0P17_22150 [Streptomyces sp. NPDC088124]|uniref:hypothetical protein n=1 Tax=Streptomyces sp. NPDC088124 TaxID=3154654 RepID=UPI003422632D